MNLCAGNHSCQLVPLPGRSKATLHPIYYARRYMQYISYIQISLLKRLYYKRMLTSWVMYSNPMRDRKQEEMMLAM